MGLNDCAWLSAFDRGSWREDNGLIFVIVVCSTIQRPPISSHRAVDLHTRLALIRPMVRDAEHQLLLADTYSSALLIGEIHLKLTIRSVTKSLSIDLV